MGSTQNQEPLPLSRTLSENFAPSSKQVYTSARRIKIRARIQYYLEEQDIAQFTRQRQYVDNEIAKSQQKLLTPSSSGYKLCEEVPFPSRRVSDAN
ncbi:hypothetical protein SS50377_24853 [Spironucleus salmonicida]|uniref:Uncharacterized protein n=1 Tax=Spironucleus salmonicida TaxID=348837 RepID=V6LZE0_9EUKA|nr:hypothetical protein SS50377_24853 [Spironucleus salmonicida]|eukprot:EST49116.1 Hypothetical protein SS50377_10601 [Spironucleus salmonicida]